MTVGYSAEGVAIVILAVIVGAFILYMGRVLGKTMKEDMKKERQYRRRQRNA